MTNPYYNRAFDVLPLSRVGSSDIEGELARIAQGFDALDQAVDTAALSVTTAGSNTTSTTSNDIGTGSKTWTVQAGKSIVVGMTYKMANTASPTNWMLGTVTAYNSTTGSLTVSVTDTSGSGTGVATWTGSIAAPITRTMNRRAVTGADTVAVGDMAGLLDITSGTFTLAYTAAPTLGAGFWSIVWNSGSGVVTHNPNASETIDGATTLDQMPGSAWLVHCDGSNFRVVVLREPQGVFHIQDQKTSGTNGQSITTATWTKRELQTSVTNTITGASITSHVIALPAGTYKIGVEAAGVYVAGSAGHQRLRLRNTSDGSTTLSGVNMSVIGTNTIAPILTLKGRFTITATKNFEVQHYVTTSANVTGAAMSSGEVEVYADVYIERVS